MSLEAFGTRRVTESLRAIGDYLDQAVLIAEGIPPGQIVKPTLEDVPSTLSPRLTSVLWKLADGSTSPSVTLTVVSNGATVVVSGVHLTHRDGTTGPFQNDIKLLKLVGPGSGATYFEAGESNITNPIETGFTATLHLVPTTSPPPPPVGPYDAFVLHKSGQTFLLVNACEVRAHAHGHGGWGQGDTGTHDATPTGTTAQPAFRLGGMFPSHVMQGDKNLDVHLVVLNGNPGDIDQVQVIDRKGAQANVTMKPIQESEVAERMRPLETFHARSELYFLKVSVPANVEPGVYFLVAKTKTSEDRLTFYVEPKK
jgi:hypothetical protein